MALQTFTAGQILTAAQMTTLQENAYNQTVSTKTASYTLVAADKGTRVVMNSASSTTITVNTSLFSAGDTLFIQNIGSGTCTITAGTATVTTASSLALAQWGGGTLYFTSAGAAIFFSGGPPAYGTATGGIGAPTSVTISGVNYQYLQFNATGTLTVTRPGFFDFLAIGGGSGSSIEHTSARANGGGGAGAVVCGSIYLAANQTITIGAGGSYVNFTNYSVGTQTNIGAASPFVVTAGGSISRQGQRGQASSCGGWGSNGAAGIAGEGLGNNGGEGFISNGSGGGGGGGWSGTGATGLSTQGGAGGTGFDMSTFIGGTPTPSHRATGGGGGGSVTGGAGGNSSACSNAGSTGSTPSSAAANTGAGGGAGFGTTQTTGNGGSGVCFIRWKV